LGAEIGLLSEQTANNAQIHHPVRVSDYRSRPNGDIQKFRGRVAATRRSAVIEAGKLAAFGSGLSGRFR